MKCLQIGGFLRRVLHQRCNDDARSELLLAQMACARDLRRRQNYCAFALISLSR
jgi:hypothetical protein